MQPFLRSVIRWTLRTAAAISVLTGSTYGANAQMFGNSKLYVGTLTCNVSGSVGFIFGSTKSLSCLLIRPNGTSESYDGKINRFGIDIGFTKAMHVAWHVYSIDESAPTGVLAGNFIGSQGSVAAGATAGSNALYGGVNNAIILTSVVVQGGKTGLNFADGIAEMSLASAAY